MSRLRQIEQTELVVKISSLTEEKLEVPNEILNKLKVNTSITEYVHYEGFLPTLTVLELVTNIDAEYLMFSNIKGSSPRVIIDSR